MESLQHCESDALLVDDLLDFSCGNIGGSCDEGDDGVGTIRGLVESDPSCFQSSAANYSLEGTVLRTCQEPSEAGEPLYSPPDELAELEWLSSFVEESYKGADQSLPWVSSEQWFSSGRNEGSFTTGECSNGRSATTSWLRMSKTGAFSQILGLENSPLIETPNASLLKANNCGSRWDKRSRSRRSSRSGGRGWTLHTVSPVSCHALKRPAAAHHEAEAEEEDVYSQASSLDYEPYYEAEQAQRKKACAWSILEGRRCSHCQVQKTPQWRAGPLGPKTLCNACGVRYKSGRLLPEYRPAASPTFITELHSNSHKKVLEMRTCKSRVGQEQDQEEFSTCSQESMSSLQN